MPRVSLLEKPLGGMGLDYTQSNSAAIEAGKDQYTRSTGVNLFNIGKIGHISPAETFDQVMTDTNSYVVSVPRAEATKFDATTLTYLMLGGAASAAPRVIRSTTFPTAPDLNQTITAHGGGNFTSLPVTGYWGEDIVTYKANNGSSAATDYLFYSWNDSVGGDVGRYDFTTFDDDFMSQVATGGSNTYLVAAVPHRMLVAPNNHLYITNGQYLAEFKGATANNGTINRTAMNLGNGYVSVDIKRYGNYIAVLSNRSVGSNLENAKTFNGEARLSLIKANTSLADNPEFVYPIPDNYASAMIVLDTIYIFTQGKNNTVKILKFNGQSFTTLPGSEHHTSKIGNAPLPNCVEFYKDMIVWSPQNATGGYLCSYGPMSSKSRGVHIPYILTDGTNTTTEVGMVKNIEQVRLWAGVKYSSTYKLANISGSGGYFVNGVLRTRLYTFPHYATINKFLFYFSQLGTGASIHIALYRDYDTTTDLLNYTISNAKFGSAREVSVPVNLTGVESFYLKITFNHTSITNTAAVIRKVEMDYTPTNQT